jgi:hypothetical protein
MSYNNHPDGMESDHSGADMSCRLDYQDYNQHMMPTPDAEVFTMHQPASYNTVPYETEQMDHNESNGRGTLQSPSPSHQSFTPDPSFVQFSTEDVPSHLRYIYNAYLASYVGNITFKEGKSVRNSEVNRERMDHAKALAFALLTHYYPAAQGFIVQSCSLGPVAKHGMSFMLKAADGSDPDYTPLPLPKDPKKGKKKLSKAQRKAKEDAKYLKQFWHGYNNFTGKTDWHMAIQAEDVAGFVVMTQCKTSADGIGLVEGNYRPLTYLAIMIDDLTTLDQIADTNDVHRGDVLADVLCRDAQIQTGYGILVYGTRIEFFDFDNGKEVVVNRINDETNDNIKAEEPLVTMCEVEDEGDLAMDMRTTDWEVVDRAFRHIAAQKVVYRTIPVNEDEQPNADNTEVASETGHGDGDGEEEFEFEHMGQNHLLEAHDEEA